MHHRLHPFLLSALALILPLSCQRMPLAEDAPAAGPEGFSLSVSLPSASSKTALGPKENGKYRTLWQTGDCLSLNGSVSQPLPSSQSGGSTATFVFLGGLSSPFNYLYPGTEEQDLVTIPSERKYVNGSFDPASAPMYGTSAEYGNLTLRHLTSVLRISLKSTLAILVKDISVSSLGGEGLSGSFRVGRNAQGAFVGTLTAVDVTPSLNCSFGGSGLLVSSTAVPVYLTIPAGTYSKGFSLSVRTSDDRVMLLKFFTEGKTVAPAKVLEFPDAEFVENGEYDLYIYDEAGLRSLANNPGANACMIQDVDMSGKSWTPIANFSGSLDGLGHCIKGLPAPFSATLSGTVRNLDLKSDIHLVETTSSSWSQGGLARTLSGTGKVSGCTFSGSLVGECVGVGNNYFAGLIGTAANNSQIDHCTLTGIVRLEGNTKLGQTAMGGLVGRLQSSGSHLTNRGRVEYVGGMEVSILYLGGVIGNHNSQGSVSHLTNEGTVKCAGSITSDAYIGGVLGAASNGDMESINATESGSLMCDFTENNVVKPHVGGLIGYIIKSTVLSNSTNRSTLTFVCKGESHTNFTAGGLVGWCRQYDSQAGYQMECELVNCANEADITVKGDWVGQSSKNDQNSKLGGILGAASVSKTSTNWGYSLKLKNCVNRGHINLTTKATYACVGGILGMSGNENIEVTNCENRGDITVTKDTELTGFLCGGIVGSVVAGNVVSGCRNAGSIQAGGLISGTVPSVMAASGCKVGGRYWNVVDRQWVVPTAVGGENPFPPLMYLGWSTTDWASHPEYYSACEVWDGNTL